MALERVTLTAEGMVCTSCERRIEKAVKALNGIVSVKANAPSGRVAVEYDRQKTGPVTIKEAIENAGYPIREKGGASLAIGAGIGLLLAALYLLAGMGGLFSFIPEIGANAGYAALFAVGLLTSVHCVAMCGGIAISQSVSLTAGERFSRLRPGLLYNAGRAVSYTAIGALIGSLGSVFDFSPRTKAAIMSIAGVLMVYLALKMLGIIRWAHRLASLVPASLREGALRASSIARKGGPFAVGLLNGFMPCGPLQSMQVYALGAGSAAAGALSMLSFSLGTIPLMLAFGLTATLVPKSFIPAMVRASAVLVMFLGVATFARSASLAGIALSAVPTGLTSAVETGGYPEPTALPAETASTSAASAAENPERQAVLTEFKGGRYVPFSVRSGVPLAWTIRIAAEDLTGCNNEVIVPAYGIRKRLVPGDNVIEFTPGKPGKISYSCWMGMIRSSIEVK